MKVQNRKQKNRSSYGMWSNTRFMIAQAMKYCKSVLGYALMEVLLSVAVSLLGLYFAPAVLAVLESGGTLKQFLGYTAVFALLLTVVRSLLMYVQSNTMFGRMEIRMEICYAIMRKIGSTSYENLNGPEVWNRMEKSMSTIDGDAATLQAAWKTLTTLLQNLIGFIIYLVLLANVEPLIIVVITVTAAAGYFFSKWINSWGYRHRDEEAEYVHRLGYIRSKASDRAFAKDIRLFGMQEWLLELYGKWYQMFQAFQIKAQKKYFLGNAVDMLLTLLRNGVAYLYLLQMVLEQHLSAAQFLLYFTAVGGFAEWVTGILNQLTELHRQSLEICEVREFLEYPEPFQLEGGLPIAAEEGASWTLELRDVSYRYAGAEQDTLRHINLILHPGEKLAIVGINGAGKTTLIKILCGFLDPTQGQVLLNGQDIRQYNRKEYYRLFAAVFQQHSLVAATLAENIAQQTDQVDRNRVWECLKQAGMSEKIKSLPQGIDTHLERKVFDDAVEFSGGQVQRLLLARALYRNAPVLVLDEPTAALDPLAESDIYLRYHQLSQGKSSIFISHRLASTRFCDRIILLSGGEIKEEGTHETLVEAGGSYAALFEVQRQYYKEEIGHEEEKKDKYRDEADAAPGGSFFELARSQNLVEDCSGSLPFQCTICRAECCAAVYRDLVLRQNYQ